MTLDPFTVVFELINFALLVFILHRFLFRPVRRVVKRRRDEIERRGVEVARREARAREAQGEYEKRLAELEGEIEARRAEALAQAEQESRVIVDGARADAHARRDAFEVELSRTREHLLGEAADDVGRLAVGAASRILREVANEDLTEAYADVAATHIARLLGDRLEDVLIRGWVPPDVEYESIRSRLVAHLGDRCRLEIRTDPDLVGGVRLLAGGHEVEASASATLQRWLEAILPESDGAAATAGSHDRLVELS